MTSENIYHFKAKLWLYSGKAAWHFITLPVGLAKEIRFFADGKRSAWGSIRVKATIGETAWKTSIFPDKNVNSYILPVKAAVRKSEKIRAQNTVSVTLEISA